MVSAARVEMGPLDGLRPQPLRGAGRPVEVWTAGEPGAGVVATTARASSLLRTVSSRSRSDSPDQRDPLARAKGLATRGTTYGDARAWTARFGDTRNRGDRHGRRGPALIARVPGRAPGTEALSVSGRLLARARRDHAGLRTECATAAAAHWNGYWTTGRRWTFEGSADPRAPS